MVFYTMLEERGFIISIAMAATTPSISLQEGVNMIKNSLIR
jgi:hypothetical protein